MAEENTGIRTAETHEDPANVVVGFKEKLAYACGGFADNMIMALFSNYMLFFFTDVLFIPATFVALIGFAARLWDAVNDPVIGALADRTNTKQGRYRPWMFWGVPPLLIGTVMVFVTLPGVSADVQKWYSFVAYFLFFLWYTIYDIPYSAAVAAVTTNYQSRGSLGSYRLGFGNIGNLFVASSFLHLVPVFGGGNLNKGYFWTAVVCMFATLPFFWIAYKGTVERVKPRVEKAPPLREYYRSLRGNRPLWMLCCAIVCWGFFGSGLGARIYYFTYVYGDTLAFASNVTFWLAGMSCGPVVNNFFLRYVKNKRTPGMITWIIGGLICIGTGFMTLTPSNLLFYHILSFCYGLCGFCGLNAIFACYPDLTEYTQKRYGVKAAGFLFSFVNFTFKLGVTVGGSSFTWLLGILGYVAGAQQSPMIQAVMKATVTWVMGSFLLLGAFFLYMYKIDEKTYNELRSELSE